jgi:hypothetical protein
MDRAGERTERHEEPEYGEPRLVEDGGSAVDRFVDDLLPGDFDWRGLVRDYPLPALLVASVGGFFLGQRHGRELLSAFRGFVDREVSKNVQSFLGEDSRDS